MHLLLQFTWIQLFFPTRRVPPSSCILSEIISNALNSECFMNIKIEFPTSSNHVTCDQCGLNRGENKGNHRLIEIDYLFVFIFLNSNYNIYLVAAFKFTFDLILYKFSREITIFFWYFLSTFFIFCLSLTHSTTESINGSVMWLVLVMLMGDGGELVTLPGWQRSDIQWNILWENIMNH